MVGAGGSAQVNSDWNATSGVAEILNKPTIPSATTDASLLTSGTLSDSRLSANVSLDNINNNFSASQTFAGSANTAPNQTAASGSSLMTRDLVDERRVIASLYNDSIAFGASPTTIPAVSISIPANALRANSIARFVWYFWTTTATAKTFSGVRINNDALNVINTATTGMTTTRPCAAERYFTTPNNSTFFMPGAVTSLSNAALSTSTLGLSSNGAPIILSNNISLSLGFTIDWNVTIATQGDTFGAWIWVERIKY